MAIQIRDIRSHVALHFGVTEGQLIAPGRQKEWVERRAICYQLCRELSNASFPQIGRYFGGRDHTTIINGASRKLPLNMVLAKFAIRTQLESGSAHSRQLVRAVPFRTNRNPARHAKNLPYRPEGIKL